ncbi:xenotropic and polytropic retrovirus receptor 1 homolog isoform X1 [Trichogramma pretiosum]|uniref:xenotropic and polytropic retrovirus receptor 1 homolog isoform X1 n=1 Tax=Trichogramma pretiosum TaxID=7493 RepID=UPI0006C9A22D|nr:xenotropic and polytropic retrovirus receptor 1 homolog isoform X1 [Trichogramma pretiosum]XP_014233610.1 xenotropic and polytropic retrovirus receptor 1 homolog isoform X1 [Trichogramma pretiosum]
MKFAEHLAAHITPEWRKQYISYEEMKAMLYAVVEAAPSAETVEPEVIVRHFCNFDERFFKFCEDELKKINTFYSEKMAEATRKYSTLISDLKISLDAQPGAKSKDKAGAKALVPTRKLRELKLAFSEFYLSLILLQNYQNLNYTGFRKILKKHDKLLNAENGSAWRVQFVETSHFFTSKDIDKVIQDTEATFTNELEGGDRQRAMKRLRVPPLGEHQSPWTTFKVGLFSGGFIVLIVAVILSSIFHDTGDNLMIAFRLYRGPMLIVQFLFLIGVNVYGWRSSGVNHVLIFELDPRNHLSEQHLMELAAVLGVVWTLSLLSFLYSASLSIPPYVNPLALTVIMLAFLLNPFKIFRHEARFWLLKIMWRIVIAPFAYVNFADFWLADQLNSLAVVFLDFHFLVCFYITNGNWLEAGSDTSQCTSGSHFIRPLVNCLPAWFRFAQCMRRYKDTREAFPHLCNAGKYATTFLVVITLTLRTYHEGEEPMIFTDKYEGTWESPWLWLWLASCMINSIYTYAWDIKMDWGFLDANAGENKFLREEVVYSETYFYYLAIFEDLVLRFTWIPSFFLTEYGYATNDMLTSIFAPCEVFRRFVWNFFRLENEHLNNCGKFRAVRDISIAPLESSDQIQILRMMDEENGVINRGKPGKGKKQASTKEDKKQLVNEEEAVDIDISNAS